LERYNLKSYTEFIKIASLFSDVDNLPSYIKEAAYGLYREAPNIPSEVLRDACKIIEDPVQKVACELIAANRLHDLGLVKDYGKNNDIAKHAGVANFLGAIRGKAITTVTNQGLNVAVGAASPVADQFQKKDSFQQGSAENIAKLEGGQ